MRVGELVPFGYHNLFVLVLLVLTFMWAAKVVSQLLALYQVHVRLTTNPPLALDQMSIYTTDFQQLIRQHFNQILRMRRTVAPRQVARRVLAAHLSPESLEVVSGEGGRLGVSFRADLLVPCSVRLYWGVPVSACQRLLQQFGGPEAATAASATSAHPSRRGPPQRAQAAAAVAPLASAGVDVYPAMSGGSPLLEMGLTSQQRQADRSHASAGEELFTEASCRRRSQAAALAAGEAQLYRTPPEEMVEQDVLGFDLRAPWPPRGPAAFTDDTLVPLVIAIAAVGDHRGGARASAAEDHTQVTLVRFKRGAEDFSAPGLQAEVLHQISLGSNSALRVLGIFGFEDDDGEAECMVCYERPRHVLLMPCRHCAICDQCLVGLRDERCPLCRADFAAYVLLPPPPAAQAAPV